MQISRNCKGSGQITIGNLPAGVETGNKKQETRDKRQETRSKKRETRNLKLET